MSIYWTQTFRPNHAHRPSNWRWLLVGIAAGAVLIAGLL